MNKELTNLMTGRLSRHENRAGFTLIELLICISLIAIVAGGAIAVVRGSQETAALSVALHEMQACKQALLQFKRDTGFLPRQGPFDLVPQGGYVPEPAQGADEFHCAANLCQLYVNPLSGTGHPLAHWNRDTRRGWNGPYLSRDSEAYVDVGVALGANATGLPTEGTVLSEIPGVADPFVSDAVGANFQWRTRRGGPAHKRRGRPYLVFDLHDENTARIVCMGPNGRYEGGGGDDLVLYLFR